MFDKTLLSLFSNLVTRTDDSLFAHFVFPQTERYSRKLHGSRLRYASPHSRYAVNALSVRSTKLDLHWIGAETIKFLQFVCAKSIVFAPILHFSFRTPHSEFCFSSPSGYQPQNLDRKNGDFWVQALPAKHRFLGAGTACKERGRVSTKRQPVLILLQKKF